MKRKVCCSPTTAVFQADGIPVAWLDGAARAKNILDL